MIVLLLDIRAQRARKIVKINFFMPQNWGTGHWYILTQWWDKKAFIKDVGDQLPEKQQLTNNQWPMSNIQCQMPKGKVLVAFRLAKSKKLKSKKQKKTKQKAKVTFRLAKSIAAIVAPVDPLLA